MMLWPGEAIPVYGIFENCLKTIQVDLVTKGLNVLALLKMWVTLDNARFLINCN